MQAMVRTFTIRPCLPTKSWYVLQVYVYCIYISESVSGEGYDDSANKEAG